MKRGLSVLLAALFLLLSGCSNSGTEIIEDTPIPLTVTFMKVGKADGIVIRTGDYTVVMDCGERSDGTKMVNFLTEHGVNAVDYMILTHFDQDHIGGAAKVLNQFPTAHVIAPDYTEDSSEYKKLAKAMEAQGLSFETPSEPVTFWLGDAEFTVCPHIAADYEDGFDNNCSLVTKVVHHGNTLLFTGDAMSERLEEIMDIGDCDLLKVPYHGREVENLPVFLDAVTPEYAVISTSAKELSEVTVQALTERNVQTFITCNDGTVTAVSEGGSIVIEADADE